MRIPVILTWSEIAADGVVDVFFRPATLMFSQTEDALAQDLQFFREMRCGILGSNDNEVARIPGEYSAEALQAIHQSKPESHVA